MVELTMSERTTRQKMSTSKMEQASSQELLSEDECDFVDGDVTATDPVHWSLLQQHDNFHTYQKDDDSLNSFNDSLRNHKLSSLLGSAVMLDPQASKTSVNDLNFSFNSANGTDAEYASGCCPLCHCFETFNDNLSNVMQSNLCVVPKSSTPLLRFVPDLDVYSRLNGAEIYHSKNRSFDFPKNLDSSSIDVARICSEQKFHEKIRFCPLCASKTETGNNCGNDPHKNDASYADNYCGSPVCMESNVNISRPAGLHDHFASIYASFDDKMENLTSGNSDDLDLRCRLLTDQNGAHKERNHLEEHHAKDKIGDRQPRQISSGCYDQGEKSFDFEWKNDVKTDPYQCLTKVDTGCNSTRNSPALMKVRSHFQEQKTQEKIKNSRKNHCRKKIAREIKTADENDRRNESLGNKPKDDIPREVETELKVPARRKRRKKHKGKKISARANQESQRCLPEISNPKNLKPGVDEEVVGEEREGNRKKKIDLNHESETIRGIDSDLVDDIKDIVKDRTEDMTIEIEITEEEKRSELEDNFVTVKLERNKVLEINKDEQHAEFQNKIASEEIKTESQVKNFIGNAIDNEGNERRFLENINYEETKRGKMEPDSETPDVCKRVEHVDVSKAENMLIRHTREEIASTLKDKMLDDKLLEEKCLNKEIDSEDGHIEHSFGGRPLTLSLPSLPNGVCTRRCFSESDKIKKTRPLLKGLVLEQSDTKFEVSLPDCETTNDNMQIDAKERETLDLDFNLPSDTERVLDSPIPKSDSLDLCDMVEKSGDEQLRWNDVPEKFLVPRACVASRNITTPQEDPGFTKVPGYHPRLNSMEEEPAEDVDRLSRTSSEGQIEDVQKNTDQCDVVINDLSNSLSVVAVLDSSRGGTESADLASGSELREQSLGFTHPETALPPLSPRPSSLSKSARPNSLIGLSKPDVNLPCLKLDFNGHDSRDGERSLSCGLIPASDGTGPQRRRFTFSSMENFISADFNDSSAPLASSLKPSVESFKDECGKNANFPTVPSVKSRPALAPLPLSTMTANPPAKRPTSWSRSLPSPRKLDLPKRPTSLNITVSNTLPVRLCEPHVNDLKTDDEVLKAVPNKVALSHAQPKELVKDSTAMPNNIESPVAAAEPEECLDSPICAAAAAAAAAVPPISSNINLRITDLGKVAPVWVPDSEAPRCMQCDSRFTFTKRRHHCRACGKVFCSVCCNLRARLSFLVSKEARVCLKCYQDLLCAQLYENSAITLTNQVIAVDASERKARGSCDAPGIVISRTENVERRRALVLGDGIHSDVDQTSVDGREFKAAPIVGSRKAINRQNSSASQEQSTTIQVSARALQSTLWHDCNGLKSDVAKMSELSLPCVVTLRPNLQVSVSIVNLDCCMGKMCWCFVTRGLCAVGQDEVVYVLECLPNEDRVPSDVLFHVLELYDRASKGNSVGSCDHSLAADGQPFLGSVSHAGFLYVHPTFQCLRNLPVPPSPCLFGILVHRSEVPWVRVFPMRLLLRLGAEYRYYPCPLVSTRFREPVFRHVVGHTIMNLLVDLRHFKYRLPHIEDLVVHMEDKRTYVNLPRARHREIKRTFDSHSDHVLALEADFCHFGDSHLVCFQNSDGKYVTQAINIQNQPRRITGTSFIVFNGALKPSSGMHAKCSIVEDGLMVQVSPDSMRELKLAISNAEDYCIGCGRLSLPQPEEWVVLKWVDDNDLKLRSVNKVRSPIDGAVLDRTRCRRANGNTNYFSANFGIRWTEIFYFDDEETIQNRSGEKYDFEESFARACCSALGGHLESLQLPVLTQIAVRLTTEANQSSYKIGTNCNSSLEVCSDDLDGKLFPLLRNCEGSSYSFELFLYILGCEPQNQGQ